jgi:lysophospholipase L1-like esterase
VKTHKTTPRRLYVLALAVNALLAAGWALCPGGGRPALAQAAVNTAYPLPDAPLPANANAAPEINAFWEADKKQMPPSGAVLFMGSSSVKLWTTLAQDFPEIPVINRGFGGSLIQDSTQYADRIALPYSPKMIIMFAGSNDLAYGNKSPQQVLQEYEDFVSKIHSALPDTRIAFISISPTVARWGLEDKILETNHLIQEFTFQNNSKSEKLDFIDTHSRLLSADGQPQPSLLRADGLHFNTEGYKIFTAIVKPQIMALATMDGVARVDSPQAAPMP